MMVNDKDKIFINMTVMNMMPIVRLLVMGNMMTMEMMPTMTMRMSMSMDMTMKMTPLQGWRFRQRGKRRGIQME